jgi:hypothetical protein
MLKYLIAFGLFLVLATEGGGAILYNGSTVPYSTSTGWDSNGSSIKQVNVAPYSSPNHLRATLIMKNWWGAAAYVPKNWGIVDLSTSSALSLYAKANKPTDLIVQLYDQNKASSSRAVFKVGTSYQKYTIQLSSLTGVSLSKVQALVFAASQSGSTTFNVDIDNIETNSGTNPPPPTPPPSSSVRDKAKQIVQTLSGKSTLLMGSGGVDAKKNGYWPQIHYQYLCCGYGDKGWRGWNQPSGEYATMVINNALAIGAIPMFTYYQIAYEFEIKNYGILTSEDLHQYLLDIKMMFTRLGNYGGPAIVHLEPDFFGYLQQYAKAQNKTPESITAKIRYSDLPECQSLPETVRGMLECMIKLGRTHAPKTKIGFHASAWGDWYDSSTSTPEQIRQKGFSVGNFLRACGSDLTDFMTLEMTDRDAGFQEATSGCTSCYLDDTNRTKPNFTDHFTWVSSIAESTSKPILYWQMPFGVPSDTRGGYDYHYRDNRVRYFFSHTQEIANVGALGVVFGAGADKQTTPETDGGQFKRAMDAYLAKPQPL